MTMTASSRNFQLKAILDDLYSGSRRQIVAAQAARRRRARYHATLSELRALSNRELADLGIPRADIRRRALEELEMEPNE